jgi:hypothetical protein
MSENMESLEAEKPIKEELHSLLEQEDLKWRHWEKESW